MELRNLTVEERKELYKVITLEHFKMVVKKNKLNTNIMVSLKKDYTRATKSELISYLEECIASEKEEKVIAIFGEVLFILVVSKFKQAKTIKKVVEEYSYAKLPEKTIQTIESYREEYENVKMCISYDSFIKSVCKVDAIKMKELLETKEKKKINKEIDDLESLKKENEDKRSQLSQLQKELKKAKKDLQFETVEHDKVAKDLTSKENIIIEYKKRFTVENVKVNVKQLLNIDVKGRQTLDVYNELKKLEDESMRKKEYTQAKDILAAKYALLKIMEENK